MWKSWQKFFWKYRGVWITTPSIAVLVLGLRYLGLLQTWEWLAYDYYMRLRPQEARDERIVIVGIDENDLHRRNQSIITDNSLAFLLRKLRHHQPRAIGLDIYRDLPVPPGHEQIVEVFESTPNLIGIQKVAGEQGRETVAPPPILKEKGQVGANDLIFDADNRVRRGLIYLSAHDDTVYSFSFHLAHLYLSQEEGVELEVDPDNPDIWRLGKVVFRPLEANDGGYVRTDAGGYQFLINYRGGDRHFETVSMTDILEDRVTPDWGRDKIVLIGKVGESFKDLFFTPYSSDIFGLSKPMTGVEIHANLTSQIISSALEGRPLIKTWSQLQEWLWIIAWSACGSLLSWQLRYAGQNNPFAWQKWLACFLGGGVLFISTYTSFLYGWWILVVPPALAFVGSAIAITAYMAHTVVEIRQVFGRYLTDEVVSLLLENPKEVNMEGEKRKVTILTSDLRGFTATSERLSPEEVIKVINCYLAQMSDVIAKYQGTIDEFIGDGILVLFGSPTARADDTQRALACAVEMQLAMKSVNEQMQEWELSPLDMGIGIHTGEVVVGNIGSEKRTKYGVIGSDVNLTYRIESYTTGGQIFISEQTLKEAGNIAIVESKKEVKPKGVKNPIIIYSVVGVQGQYNLHLPKDEQIFLPLSEKIPIQYQILSGKHIDDVNIKAAIIELSAKCALIKKEDNSPKIPEYLTDIKLNLFLSEASPELNEDVYGKVLEKEAPLGCFYLRFTAKPPAVLKKLESLRK